MLKQNLKRLAGKRAVSSGIAGAFVLTFACCGARAADYTIHIDNFAFTPAALTIKSGDKVTWKNGDDIPHNVVSSDRSAFRSKVMDSGQEFSFTFTAAGSFEYFCALHPHMKGVVIVAP